MNTLATGSATIGEKAPKPKGIEGEKILLLQLPSPTLKGEKFSFQLHLKYLHLKYSRALGVLLVEKKKKKMNLFFWIDPTSFLFFGVKKKWIFFQKPSQNKGKKNEDFFQKHEDFYLS